MIEPDESEVLTVAEYVLAIAEYVLTVAEYDRISALIFRLLVRYEQLALLIRRLSLPSLIDDSLHFLYLYIFAIGRHYDQFDQDGSLEPFA